MRGPQHQLYTYGPELQGQGVCGVCVDRVCLPQPPPAPFPPVPTRQLGPSLDTRLLPCVRVCVFRTQRCAWCWDVASCVGCWWCRAPAGTDRPVTGTGVVCLYQEGHSAVRAADGCQGGGLHVHVCTCAGTWGVLRVSSVPGG